MRAAGESASIRTQGRAVRRLLQPGYNVSIAGINFSMRKRIIILGKSGFIGGSLFKGFSQNGEYETAGFSSKECDLLSPDSAQKALSDLKKEDIVVMAAAITRTSENTFSSFLKNVQMIENLGQAISRRPVSQLIYLSSVDVYGCLERNFKRKNTKINESFDLRPDDYYGIGKGTREVLLRNYLAKQNIILTVLRLCGVYGPGDKDRSLIGRFIQSVTQGEKIRIYGDGSDRRDYLYIHGVYRVVDQSVKI